MSQRLQSEPKSPMPPQHQEKPGIEAEMKPKPRYNAPLYKGSEKLKDKVALITGGDSGIGRAVAVLFAREGADVAIVYLPEEQSDAEETKQAVERRGARPCSSPAMSPSLHFCREAVDRTVNNFGRLDILVNNAAYQQHQEPGRRSPTSSGTRPSGPTSTVISHGQGLLAVPQRGSAIINTGSITGLEGSKQLLDYSATKGAIHAFTKALAQNLVEKQSASIASLPARSGLPLNVADKEPEKVASTGRHPVEAAGAARGDRAGICLLRVRGRLQLHHGRGPHAAGRRDLCGMIFRLDVAAGAGTADRCRRLPAVRSRCRWRHVICRTNLPY